MPIREFTDSAGTHWRAWSTMPSPAATLVARREGWLTFESSQSRRRLSPIPEGWESASDARLADLCDGATPAVRSKYTAPDPMTWRPKT